MKSRLVRKLAGQTAKSKRKLAYAGKAAKAKAVKRVYRGKAKRSYASKRKLSSKARYATTLKRTKKSRVARSGGKRGAAQLASRNGPTKRYTKAAAAVGGRVSGNLAGCIPSRLRVVLNQISRNFGAVKVTSSYRSPSHNRRIGGARKSWHMKCQAVDFRVSGNGKAVLSFIRSHPSVGGYKRYPAGFFHIDTGPRRTW